jgi:hypothetical protein
LSPMRSKPCLKVETDVDDHFGGVAARGAGRRPLGPLSLWICGLVTGRCASAAASNLVVYRSPTHLKLAGNGVRETQRLGLGELVPYTAHVKR